MQKTGKISVQADHIFPIIKKFLYSDHEIFLRELVSNAVDACQKLSALSRLGQATMGDDALRVQVKVDKDQKTITVSDNGIGMSADEIEKYINQIAFSGATEFLEKYKDASDTQVIGHFGLGFYSAFMVADTVEIHSRSHREGEEAAHWTCTGTTDFELKPGTRTDRGTDIILHVNEENVNFLENYEITRLLEKYGRFLPIPVWFNDKQVNDTEPLWKKQPSSLQDSDYQAFYEKLFPYSEPPLFHIHLNVDYPFNLTGVLYFPKVKPGVEPLRNKIQLYCNQVFVTDEVKDILPDFLMLLHGVIDSPDIPLNVSRSYLQSDQNVKKINSHITKKVADKLEELFKNDRKQFESKWESLDLFMKYGMITDTKFEERAEQFALLKTTDNRLITPAEYEQEIETLQTDKDGNKVWLYANDIAKQAPFLQSAASRGYQVLIMDGPLDAHFISRLESKHEKRRLKRIDSEPMDQLVPQENEMASAMPQEKQNELKTWFEEKLARPDLKFSLKPQPETEPLIQIFKPEFQRRMQEMEQLGGGMAFMGGFNMPYDAVINPNHPLANQLVGDGNDEQKETSARHALDLALLAQHMLTGDALNAFIQRSFDLLKKNH